MISQFLEPEVERLLSKAAMYGPGTVWKQNEFSEILQFPTPLSLSLFRRLADHDGATGMVCGELGIFYNIEVPVVDYIETLFGRIFVNDAAENKLLHQKKRSMLKAFSSSVKLEKENRTYYREFNNIRDGFESFYREQDAVDLKTLSDREVLERVNFLNLSLNKHYCHVVKAGLLANLNVDTLSTSYNGDIPSELFSADLGKLLESDSAASSVFAFRHEKLRELIGFSASVEYELGCPRFCEIEEHVIQPDIPHRQAGMPLPGRGKQREALFYFRLYESLKVIFKTLLLRELYLLRMAIVEAGSRSGLGDDIFYLTDHEISSIYEQSFAGEIDRRKVLERAFQNIDLPTIVTPAVLKTLLHEGEVKESHELNGISVIGREFEGHALICRSERDLESADSSTIIIAKHASPNLVMAFSKAAGIITETGGLLSHLAIVAREYDFPLLLQARDATRLIKNGDYIKVDSKGRILKS